jgi:hypothetical protein
VITRKTNELKKGTFIRLANGWDAEIFDNMKGNTRLAKVYGDYTEIGSVYSHDIVAVLDAIGGNVIARIEYTPSQLQCKQWSDNLFASLR